MEENRYFESLRGKTSAMNATGIAFIHYSISLDSNSSEFEVRRLPPYSDSEEFLNTLRAAGIKAFVVTDIDRELISCLNLYARLGCTRFEPATITRDVRSDSNTERIEIEGIRVTL